MKKKRREMEQASLDAASDLLDTDSNATFAMVWFNKHIIIIIIIIIVFVHYFARSIWGGRKRDDLKLKLKFEMHFIYAYIWWKLVPLVE